MSLSDAPVTAALELAEGLATYPQATMLSDRASVYDGYGLSREEALAVEMRHGLAVLGIGREGAERFAGGEGRGGVGV